MQYLKFARGGDEKPMFLKRIELGGFKSFADKTEMEFVRA